MGGSIDVTVVESCSDEGVETEREQRKRNSLDWYNGVNIKEKYNEYTNVSICLIDIVGFSKWCAKYTPKQVMDSMIEYNDTINTILADFGTLTKVELVGDSCLVIGGMFSDEKKTCDVCEMVAFCRALINVDIGETIFHSQKITLRIGVHIGDVFGTFMKNPMKFQLYGNDINTTSRLESACIPQLIHVSENVIKRMQQHPSQNLDYGNVVTKLFKGVGEVQCAYLTNCDDTILIVDDLKICQLVIGKILQKYPLKYLSDMESVIEKLKSKIYKTVILDIYTETYCILEDLKWFRTWETIHRNTVQHIVAVTACIDLIPLNYKVLFNNVVSKDNLRELVDIVNNI